MYKKVILMLMATLLISACASTRKDIALTEEEKARRSAEMRADSIEHNGFRQREQELAAQNRAQIRSLDAQAAQRQD